MSSRDDGGPAFPAEGGSDSGLHANPGMSLRDWFAGHAPMPTDEKIDSSMRMDRSRNPHNDSYKPKLRERHEIIADLAYAHADAMLAARKKDAAI